ncbi:peroxidase-like [Amphibalanus amphitrite]|uniref:peroxidase-like n=1 Tax=Amphibalanus amphitrite TaxID=1232801 RepID=UPI001C91CCB1|nr:peroxidase-like [Amphibalanus amphitrite]XP_043188451.1 peroxidase-like [Amphibalanus amphitrite]
MVQLQEVSVRGTDLYDGCPTKSPEPDQTEPCPPLSVYFRTADGSCNNANSRYLGAAMTPFARFLPPRYNDGVQTARRSVNGGTPLPSARDVSLTVHRDVNLTSTRITMMVMQWGQFLDHDLTSSAQARGFNGSVPRCCLDGRELPVDERHPDCMPINIPTYDPFYSRFNQTCMEFVRSSPAPRPDCTLGPRDQINQITSYLDASNVYGSSDEEMTQLRLFNGGMLRYTHLRYRKPLLPPGGADVHSECRMTNDNLYCFTAGDDRVNEQPGLTSMHTLWLREHNRVARELARFNPGWGDDRLFHESRKVVGAMMQVITYNEWLPVVLGRSVIKIFDVTLQKYGYFYGYNSSVNPSIANSFGAAAFRFGHSLVNSKLSRCDKFGNHMNLDISLHKELMNPAQLHNIGSVDRLMFGLLYQPAQRRDVFISRELTNRLFQTNQPFGMDLASINIQRGRDHGLPPYNTWRRECGLRRFTNWAQLLKVMDDDSVGRLRVAYKHLDDIDLFAGGLAERPVKGGLVGPTFSCIIGQQFLNLKVGDRFWFENGGMKSSFTPSQLHQLRKTTLARVLCDNLDDIDVVRPLVMRTGFVSERNRPVSCQLIRRVSLRPWAENQEPPPRPSPSPPPPPAEPALSRPAEAFQFTPKNRVRLNITALGQQQIAELAEIHSSLSNRRPSPQYLLEDELEAAQEPAENYLEELPAPLPASIAYTGRPLYDLLDLGDLLARRPVRRRRAAGATPPAA